MIVPYVCVYPGTSGCLSVLSFFTVVRITVIMNPLLDCLLLLAGLVSMADSGMIRTEGAKRNGYNGGM